MNKRRNKRQRQRKDVNIMVYMEEKKVAPAEKIVQLVCCRSENSSGQVSSILFRMMKRKCQILNLDYIECDCVQRSGVSPIKLLALESDCST